MRRATSSGAAAAFAQQGDGTNVALGVPPGSGHDNVIAAMEGHVIASGELVGTHPQVVQPPK
jgi:hypothetical protein